MKKVFLLGLLIVSLITGYFILFNQKASVSKIVPQDSKMSSRKLFLGARKNNKPATNVSSLSIPDGCADLTNNLEEIDFNIPVKEWVLNLDLTLFAKCQRAELQKRLADLKENCLEKFDDDKCSTDAVFLRALLRTTSVEDAEDKELLADLILKEFAGNQPDFDKLKKYADKMMVLDPDQMVYQKLWASSQIISKLMKSKSAMSVAEIINQRVNPELWNDPSMNGVKLAMMTGLEPNNVEEYARGYLSQKSDSSMHEVLGWALWKQNRQAEAIAQLQRAVEMSPKDAWLKEQLRKLKGAGTNADSYQARIMLGFDFRDLYN